MVFSPSLVMIWPSDSDQNLDSNPSGFLQVAVSKARNSTVLVCTPCLLALPIQP